MKVLAIAGVGGVVALTAVLLLSLLSRGMGAKAQQEDISWQPIQAKSIQEIQNDAQQQLAHVVRAGVVVARDPVLVSAPFDASLTELVEDETWVEQGTVILRLDNEQVDTKVADLLANLSTKQHEIQLKREEQRFAAIEEAQRQRNTQRALQILQTNLRILTTQPIGGNRLVELDQELQPIESALVAGRQERDRLESVYQDAQALWLRAQDQLMESRDAMMEAQLAIDIAEMQQKQQALSGQEVQDDSQELRDQLPALQENFAMAEDEERQAATALAAAEEPLLKQQEKIAPLLAEEEELLILIEIEKMALPAMRLQFDLRRQQLTVENAERQLKDGTVAFEAGAISALRLQELQNNLSQAEGELSVLQARLELAQEGVPAEEIAAAQAEVDRAAVNAERVVTNAEARLAQFDADISVMLAEEASIVHEMRQLRQRYPRLLDAEEQRLQQQIRQLQLVDDSAEEIARIEQEIKVIAAERAVLPKDPGAVLAPVTGVARLASKKVGSGVGTGDPLVRIYPPKGLQIRLAVDEATLLTLRPDAPVSVRIPAISETDIFRGKISEIGGMGYDKSRDVAGRSEPTGIVLFPVRAVFDTVHEELRQGMTAIVTWQHAEISEDSEDLGRMVSVPRAAARLTASGQWQVRIADDQDRAMQWHSVTARPLGIDTLLVSDGLHVGDTVWVPGRMVTVDGRKTNHESDSHESDAARLSPGGQ